MSNSIIEIISSYIGYSPEVTIQLSNNAHKTYRRYYIPKKKGGQRAIFHPSKRTKSLQYAFIETILSRLPVHESAAAYIKGLKSPLLVNARKHAYFSYTIRVDFKDFFPCICPADLIKCLLKSDEFGEISDEDQKFLSRSLFVRYQDARIGLGIGAPSSPIISNIVMFSLDERMARLAMSLSPDSIYSRYADDIVYSSNKKGACKEFYQELEEILKNVKSPNLKVNARKTVLTSRGTKRVITGLHICPDRSVSLGRRNKRYIKKLIYDFKSNNLDSNRRSYLSGYLSFILDVEPDFYNRLVLKYGAEMVSRAHRRNPTMP